MKKVLILFLSLFFPLIGFAQNFEFETFRTEESPGFFGIRIFPGTHLTPIEIKNVFVKHFSKNEEAIYSELISLLEGFGLTVINKEELHQFSHQKGIRIIILGAPLETFLNFTQDPEVDTLEHFENFTRKHLGPVFFQDVRFQFGGNISQVIPAQISFWGEEELLLVGKFEKAMRTYVEIIGVNSEGEVMASAILDLRDFQNVPIAYALPEIWEERLGAQKSTEHHNLFWLSVFSWGLGGIGFFLLLFVFISRIKKKDKKGLLGDLNQKPTEETLPFEIESKK